MYFIFIRLKFQFPVTEEQANKCEYPVSGSVQFGSGWNILVELLIRSRNSGSRTIWSLMPKTDLSGQHMVQLCTDEMIN